MPRKFDDLHPYPIERHLERLAAEWAAHRTLYGIKEREFWRPDPAHDLSMTLHGRRVQNPLGPAAGPQTQLIQNIVISWLLGCRVMELKTVQVIDDLEIPRPCIDTRTYGFNVEWSQELTVPQSLEEYVAAWMIIRVLIADDVLGLGPDADPAASMPLFDLSVGYDLKGIQTEKVQRFMTGMRDASAVIEALRPRLPARYRDLEFEPCVSDSVTLSTFHGCPKDEIEAIGRFLLDEGYHTIIKLNPTQLPAARVDHLLHDVLGYTDVTVNPNAYVVGMTFDEARDLVQNLLDHRAAIGAATLGVKLTNTLEVKNTWDYFTEETLYMSGRPLHVLAVNLLDEIRRAFGGDLLVSFSAGIEPDNFHEALALGLAPITTCTDLLTGNGYRRLPGYFKKTYKAMDAAGVRTLEEFIAARAGCADGAMARVANTAAYVEALLEDPRYRREASMKPPKKIGSMLDFWDCINCDKCVKICPNDANFKIEVEPFEGAAREYTWDGAAWAAGAEAPLRIEKKKQYANFADFCNECALCDQYCPEDGGPYIVKPRFFGSRAAFDDKAHLGGILVEGDPAGDRLAFRTDDEKTYWFRFGDRAAVRFEEGGTAVPVDETGAPGIPDGELAAGTTWDTRYWRYATRIYDSLRRPDQRDNYLWPLLRS